MDVTARDVARAAGVSESTVSRALARSSVVAAETRDRVRKAADQLGYTARSTVSAMRTGTIGIVVPDIANPYFSALSKSMRSSARASGLRAVIVESDEDVRQEREAYAHLAQVVDALIICSPRGADADLQAIAAQIPTIITTRTVEGVPSVGIDEVYGVCRVVSHLRALGHRRIAYVGGPVASVSETSRSAALEQATNSGDDVEIIRVTNVAPMLVGGLGAADEVIATGASAVIAYNDLVALGLMAQARQRAVSVPHDLSVVGFDDVLVAEAAFPRLTTVGMPLRAMSTTAVGMLHEWLDSGARPATPAPIHGQLVVRDSTAPARAE